MFEEIEKANKKHPEGINLYEEIEKAKKKHPEEVKQEETFLEALQAGHMEPNITGEMGGSQSVIIEDIILSQTSLGKRSKPDEGEYMLS